MPKLIIENLQKKYAERIIFKSVNIKIKKNGFYVLTGKNGSGKSTLFKILNNIEKADGGEIYFYNSLNEKECVCDNISYCPALPILFDSLTVLENIKIISNDEEKINYYLDLFELSKLKTKKTKKLSAGERIRVCLIRTFLENKPIILLDEITKHLDKRLRNIVLNELKILSNERIIIYTTHYKSDIPDLTNNILTFDEEQISYESDEENYNIIIAKNNFVDYKIVKKIFNWKQNYLFLILILFMILIFIILVTMFSEENYKLLYRNSVDQNSYIEMYNGRTIINGDVNINDLSILNNTSYYKVYYASNVFNNSIGFSQVNNIFDCNINYFSVLDNYNNHKLKNNEVVISDFLYFSLSQNFSIFEDIIGEYFEYFGTKFYIYYIYETSFKDEKEKFIYKPNTLPNNKDELNSLINIYQKQVLDELLKDTDFYFDYKNIYNQMFCNYDTFETLIYLRRSALIEKNRSYYNNVKSLDGVKYNLSYGRLPKNDNEVVIDENTLKILSIQKFGNNNKPKEECLNIEYEFSFLSQDRKKEQKINLKVVGTISSIEITQEDETIKKYNNILIDYNDNIVKEILCWKDYFVSNETIGLSNIDEKVAESLYNNDYILINNNTLNLINSYKIKSQFTNYIKIITISVFVILCFILALSIVLEYKFLNNNFSVLKYVKINRKIITNYYLIKSFIISLIFSSIYLVCYIKLTEISSEMLSNYFKIKYSLFNKNLFIALISILVFIVIESINKYISLKFNNE